MNASKTVHQCLFCPQTFNSAIDKDDHVLKHFTQEFCTKCDENLIRIGGYLYVQHKEATCINKKPKTEDSGKLCTAIECVPIKQEVESEEFNDNNTAKQSITLDTNNTELLQIKTEPVDRDEKDNGSDDTLISMKHVGYSTVSINRIPEDPLLETDSTPPPQLKRRKLLDHIIHKKEIILKCTHKGCDKTFKSEQDQKLHLKTHIDKKYVCSVDGCGKQFKFQAILNLHQSREHNMKSPVQMKDIRAQEPAPTSLITHTQTSKYLLPHHEDDDNDDGDADPMPQMAICKEELDIKMEPFEEFDDENITQKSDDYERNYDIFNVEENSAESKSNDDQEQSDTNKQDERPRYECKQCGKKFVRKSAKIYHRKRYHSGIGVHTCAICNTEFTSQACLAKHRLNVHRPRENKFKCEMCNDAFPFKSQLCAHIDNVHLEISKQFSCNHCGKIFKSISSIREHARVHTGDIMEFLPFQCTYQDCGKCFMSRSESYRHELSHIENKSYECDFEGCKAAFNHKRGLNLHKDRQHGIFKDYHSCMLCIDVFNTIEKLEAHMRQRHLKNKLGKKILQKFRLE